MTRTATETKLSLKWRAAFDAWESKLARWVEAAKGSFDPNQPRVSAGNSDGGQWTGRSGGSGTGGTSIAAAAGGASPKVPKSPKTRPRSPKRRPSPVKKLNVPANKLPAKVKGPLPPAPRVTKRKPLTRKLENRAAKELGKWLLKAAARRALGPIGVALDAIEIAVWIHSQYPDIQSYFEEPKSLRELQDAVSNPLVGYEIHHIVERVSVERDGIGHNRVNSSENLARIPTWRHHEVTAWYMIQSDDFGGQSPRDYLRGKTWEEKYSVGLDALKKHGVLK